jgi:hypothetical protein
MFLIHLLRVTVGSKIICHVVQEDTYKVYSTF